MIEETRRAFAEIVGPEFVLTDEESRARAAGSWSPVALKRRDSGLIQMVVQPADAAQIAAILRRANATKTRVYPVGGGSNTVGRPDDATPGIALDLSRLNAVSWDEESLLVTAGAGCTLAEVEAQLNRHEYTLGHLPRSIKLATVGGSVAMNAIGLLSGRYGRQADITAALEAVLPNGDIVTTSPAPGANAAFDLHSLFIGTEGRFGVITAVTMRMSPVPEVRAWGAFAFASLSDALDAARLIRRSDARPAVLRVFDAEALPPEAPAVPALLLLGFEGEELGQTGPYQLAYAVCQRVGGTALSADIGEAWFERREETTAWAANGRPGGLADVFAIGATWSTIKRVEKAVRAALSPFVTRLALEIAHPTPNGAILEWVWEAQADPPTPEEYIALYGRIANASSHAARAADGVIAPSFGVGATRAEAFAAERGPEAMRLLQTLKTALDPNGILPYSLS